MLASPDVNIRAQAFNTLVAICDPSVVTTVAEDCNRPERRSTQSLFNPLAAFMRLQGGGTS